MRACTMHACLLLLLLVVPASCTSGKVYAVDKKRLGLTFKNTGLIRL